MRRLNEQGPRMDLALAADVAGAGWLFPRLPDLRIQTQVPDQLLRARKTANVTHDGDDGQGRDQACQVFGGLKVHTIHGLPVSGVPD